MKNENYEMCKRVAENLERHVRGNGYTCPHCWNYIDGPDDDAEEYTCPACGSVIDIDDLEPLSLYDYFSDCYDIEFTVGSDKQYRSVRIMVACGGPNIYINTATKNVELYWWNERETYPIKYDVIEEVDAWAEEYWECL